MLNEGIPVIPEQIEDGLPSPAIESSNCSFETFRRENAIDSDTQTPTKDTSRDNKNRNLRLTLNWLAPNNGKKLKTKDVSGRTEEDSMHGRSVSSNSTYSSSANSFVTEFPIPPQHLQQARTASNTPTTATDDRSDVNSISSASLFTHGEEVYTPPPGVAIGGGLGVGVSAAGYYNNHAYHNAYGMGAYKMQQPQTQPRHAHTHAQTHAHPHAHMQLHPPPPPIPTGSRPPQQNGTLYTKEGLPIDIAQLVSLLNVQQQGVQGVQSMHPIPVQQTFAPPQQPPQYHYPQPLYAAQPIQQHNSAIGGLHKPISTPAFRSTLSPPPPSLAPSAKKSVETISSTGAPPKEKIKTYGRGGAARKIKTKK